MCEIKKVNEVKIKVLVSETGVTIDCGTTLNGEKEKADTEW